MIREMLSSSDSKLCLFSVDYRDSFTQPLGKWIHGVNLNGHLPLTNARRHRFLSYQLRRKCHHPSLMCDKTPFLIIYWWKDGKENTSNVEIKIDFGSCDATEELNDSPSPPITPRVTWITSRWAEKLISIERDSENVFLIRAISL